MKEVHDLIDAIIQMAATEGEEGREDYSLDLIQLQNELRDKYAALQQQLAAAREALAEMTADRDNWCDQAAARVNDWHEARSAKRAAAAEKARILAEFPLFDENGLSEEFHCEWALQQDRKRLHAMLSGKDPSVYPIHHDYEVGTDD